MIILYLLSKRFKTSDFYGIPMPQGETSDIGAVNYISNPTGISGSDTNSMLARFPNPAPNGCQDKYLQNNKITYT
jgi:hypothetical protein